MTGGPAKGSRRAVSAPGIVDLGERCCGCGACAAACPVSCIDMQADRLGFRYPMVDAERCVGCGSCDKVCPAQREVAEDGLVRVLWACSNDEDERLRSSSGGVFGLLAQDILARGGTVYGAAFADGVKSVRHVRVDDPAQLDAVMRSKYVQSSIGADVYRAISDDLRAGRAVLFCGTACQAAGIAGYLDRRRVPRDGLLLADVVCHGVPAPELWARWVAHRESEAGARACGVNFRSKAAGWLAYSVAYAYAAEKDGPMCRSESGDFRDDWYMRAFLANASLRGSCFSCPAKRRGCSDLTLGDFWGVQDVQPEAFDNKGTSAVIVNTARGDEAIASLGDRARMGESSFERVIAGNPSLVKPVLPHPRRERFLTELGDGTPIADLTRRWPFELVSRPSLVSRMKGAGCRLIRALRRSPHANE